MRNTQLAVVCLVGLASISVVTGPSPSVAGGLAQHAVANDGVLPAPDIDLGGRARDEERLGAEVTVGDFDGDGNGDVAAAVPTSGYWVRDYPLSQVHVVYGSKFRGLLQDSTQRLSRAGLTFAKRGRQAELRALAAGDVHADGYDDLLWGSLNERVAGRLAGAVLVIPGSPKGLRPARAQRLTQATPGVPGDPYASSGYFGKALSVGQLGRGAADDLVVGTGTAAYVLYGSQAGITGAGSQRFTSRARGVAGDGQKDDGFGTEVQAANVGLSRQDDLLIAAPYHRAASGDGPVRIGALFALFGSPSGVVVKHSQKLTIDSPGVPGSSSAGLDVQLGLWALAAANFGRGRYEDVAATDTHHGKVYLFYGGGSGLQSRSSQVWHQDRPGVRNHYDRDDGFGQSLTAGNVGHGQWADLAITSSESRSEEFGYARGAVAVLYGSESGLRARHDQLWYQNQVNPGQIASYGDDFGAGGNTLAIGDISEHRPADLVIGTPSDGAGGDNLGSASVMYGRPLGLRPLGSQFLHESNFVG